MNDCERLSIEQQKVLLYLMDNQRITRKVAMEVIEMQRSKTFEILRELLEADLIEVHGKGRGTYYTLLKK